jgi:hypothetical protein
MRKQLKDKIRSCPLCKPHKRGWSCRWTPQERQAILETDRELRLMKRHFSASFSGAGPLNPLVRRTRFGQRRRSA